MAAIVDYGALERLLADGGTARYRHNDPFPHIAIENILADPAARAAHAEILATEIAEEERNYSTFRKHRQSDRAKIGPAAGAVIDELNSPAFIAFLEKLTGIEKLIADPGLEGGGIHRIGRGGFLKVHTDFNFHRQLHLYRRLNILVYLNPEWDETWGGAIGLWDQKAETCAASYLPLWNRAVIFSTTDLSYHGHPDPLAAPPDLYRNSIALYYYTEAAPEDAHHFDRSEFTNYQPRPGEDFGIAGRLQHWSHQAQIRSPAIRRAAQWLKGLLK